MKILLINTYRNMGGAARGTERIYRGLSKIGENVCLLTGEGLYASTDRSRNVEGSSSLFFKLVSRSKRKIDHFELISYPKRQHFPFSTGSVRDFLESKIQKINPDIIHLNWISDGFMKIESISKLKKPIVWTLHDAWAFTGGCHYTFGCERFSKSCGLCPQLGSDQELDLTHRIWTRKFKSWKNLNITLVAPSHWIASEARKSSIFGNNRIEVIPNGIDTRVFHPFEKTIARKELGLPLEKKLILFGALDATTDPRKGYQYLKKALQTVGEIQAIQSEVELVIFGSAKSHMEDRPPIKTNYFGRIDDDLKLAKLYSACDIMIVPSKEESFGQTASEAMACGTPVAAFATTGLLDIIDHLKNGFLARAFDHEDLARGILYLLEDRTRWFDLSAAARKRALESFEFTNVARSYLNLYQRIAYPTPG